jgi:hypothetical protein
MKCLPLIPASVVALFILLVDVDIAVGDSIIIRAFFDSCEQRAFVESRLQKLDEDIGAFGVYKALPADIDWLDSLGLKYQAAPASIHSRRLRLNSTHFSTLMTR